MNRQVVQKTWKRGFAQWVTVMASAILLISSCSGESETVSETRPPVAAPAAPIVKPDVAGVKLTPKGFMASANLSGRDPKLVADGDTSTGWSSGDAPPQWIQLDLGEKVSIAQVLLSVDQYPDGPTVHEIYAGPTPETLKLIGTLKGDTRTNQWLELKAAAADVRFVKVSTVTSPSWVGWHEIGVYK